MSDTLSQWSHDYMSYIKTHTSRYWLKHILVDTRWIDI